MFEELKIKTTLLTVESDEVNIIQAMLASFTATCLIVPRIHVLAAKTFVAMKIKKVAMNEIKHLFANITSPPFVVIYFTKFATFLQPAF